MRGCYFSLIFFLMSTSSLEAQSHFEIDVSLLHPVSKAQEMDNYYGMDYSLDPTLEVLYHFPVSPRITISSGLYFQYGEHNWEELLRKPIQNPDGTWYPSKTIWLRELNFFSFGVPIQAELNTGGFIFNSIFAGVIAGNHLSLTLKEQMKNFGGEYIKATPPGYRWLFWDVYAGIQKSIFHDEKLNLGIKPKVGYKNNLATQTPGKSNYFYYGFGISTSF